jgi:hypothetical protein
MPLRSVRDGNSDALFPIHRPCRRRSLASAVSCTMRRYLKWNAIAAVGFVAFWTLAVLVEVKVRNFPFVGPLVIASYFLLLPVFVVVGGLALARTRDGFSGLGAALGIVLAPLVWIVGVNIVLAFKFSIGGHW